MAAESLDLTTRMASGRGRPGVLLLLKQPTYTLYMLSSCMRLSSRQDFRHLFSIGLFSCVPEIGTPERCWENKYHVQHL